MTIEEVIKYNRTFSKDTEAYREPMCQALRWNGDDYIPLNLWPRADAIFHPYSTDWEKIWSPLTLTSRQTFIPVVNDDFEVVGHYGNVAGGWFTKLMVTRQGLPPGDIKRQGSPYETYYTNDLGALLRSGVRAYVVDRDQPTPPEYVICDALTTEHSHWVEVLMDGEVHRTRKITVNNTGYLEPSPVTPYDLYMIAKVMVNFGGSLGARMVNSLAAKATARRAAPGFLNGPTAAVAEDVARKMATAPRVINATAKARLAEAYAHTSPDAFARTLKAEANSGAFAATLKAEANSGAFAQTARAEAGAGAEARAGVNNSGRTALSESGYTPMPEAEAAISRELKARRQAFADDLMREISESVRTRGYGLSVGEYNAAWDRLSVKWAYPFGNR